MLACTANGSICFVSPVYAGSISDVELTQVSEFLDAIEGKQGILIMANKGFTTSDKLKRLILI